MVHIEPWWVNKTIGIRWGWISIYIYIYIYIYISSLNLVIYINPIENLQKDFKAPFKDLLNMEIPEWIISLYDVEVERANLDKFHREEFIEISFDFQVKFMYILKEIGYYWMNEKKLTKYPKFCATVEPILLFFQSLYIVESEFKHVHCSQSGEALWI